MCGRVALNNVPEHVARLPKRTLTVTDKVSRDTRRISTDADGLFCQMLPVGEYEIEVGSQVQ